jgi:hypothetical protein
MSVDEGYKLAVLAQASPDRALLDHMAHIEEDIRVMVPVPNAIFPRS